MKKVLFACGNGIVTSTMVANKVVDYLKEHGVEVKYNQCKVQEVEHIADEYDLVVTSGKFSKSKVKVPVIMAISLLTGIGEEATLEEILEAVKA